MTGEASGHAGSREAAGAPRYTPLSLLLLAALALLWGLNWSAMKLAMREIPVLYFRTFCTVMTGPLLLLLSRLGGERLALGRREVPPVLLLSLLNITIWLLLSALALTLMGAGRASIIAYTMPVWAIVISRIFTGERLTGARIAGLAFGMAGLAVLVLPDLRHLATAPAGAFVMLAGSITWACGTVAQKRFHWTRSAALLTGWQLVLGGLPILVMAVLSGPPPDLRHLSLVAILAQLYAACIGMLLCQWIWYKVLELLPAGIASLGTLAIPMVGVFSSAFILGERVSAYELVSLALVVTAIALVLRPPPARATLAPAAR